MIKIIDHRSIEKSNLIYDIFQKSYAVEAALLDHPDFPPLNRTSADIRGSSTNFYAYHSAATICAIMELEENDNHIHIRSLTVSPAYFRKKIGHQLLCFVRDHFNVDRLTVETGHANFPAVNFYLNFGFKKDQVWMTDVGIEKISFILER